MATVIEEKNLYSNFINSLKSPETKQNYAYWLKRYMDFHHFTKYSELLSIDREDRIKDYVIHLANKERGTSKSAFMILFASLRNFYEMNDIEGIKWRKLQRYEGEELPEHEDRCYRDDEILTLVQNAPDLKTKAAILLMASSGMRVGSLSTMLVSHLSRRGDLYRIDVYKGLKGKGQYYTFCTPEAAKAIDSYLQFRERCGEKLNSDSLLFRKDFDSDFHEQARNNIQEWSKFAIKASINRLLIKTGLTMIDRVNPHNRKEAKQTHGLRKFFVTQLANANLNDVIIKKLTGHRPGKDMTQRYSKQTEEDMLLAYEKAIDLLTIDPTKRLEKKVDQLKERNDRLDAILDRIDSLEKQMGIKF